MRGMAVGNRGEQVMGGTTTGAIADRLRNRNCAGLAYCCFALTRPDRIHAGKPGSDARLDICHYPLRLATEGLDHVQLHRAARWQRHEQHQRRHW